MFKQLLIMIILSAIAVFFVKEIATVAHALGFAQAWAAAKIYHLFHPTTITKLIIDIVTLVLIPCILGLIPAFIYWLIEKKEMPKLMYVIWFIWIIILLVFVLH